MIDMNTPDWKDAPEWANWLAMDADGRWFWYKDKPEAGHSTFITQTQVWEATPIKPDWKETRQQRPTA